MCNWQLFTLDIWRIDLRSVKLKNDHICLTVIFLTQIKYTFYLCELSKWLNDVFLCCQKYIFQEELWVSWWIKYDLAAIKPFFLEFKNSLNNQQIKQQGIVNQNKRYRMPVINMHHKIIIKNSDPKPNRLTSQIFEKRYRVKIRVYLCTRNI